MSGKNEGKNAKKLISSSFRVYRFLLLIFYIYIGLGQRVCVL